MYIDVPESHANILRTLCGLGEYGELPEKVVKAYWNRKRLHDRVQFAVTHQSLIEIADRLGYGKPLEREANPSVVDLFRKGAVKRESPVQIQWRNGWRNGVLKNVVGGEVIVQIEGDSEERKLAADKVRVAELVVA